MSDERRLAERYECSRIGKISGQGLQKPVECVVRDVSTTGALLVFKKAVVIPKAFDLRIAGIERSFECEVRRRTAQTLGVRFTD